MNKDEVYFTLYDDPSMRSKTIYDAQARQLKHKGSKMIRIVIEQDGAVGVPKIVGAEFVGPLEALGIRLS